MLGRIRRPLDSERPKMSIVTTDRGPDQRLPAERPAARIKLRVDHRPDLVLLDLHLPDISGEEVLHALKSHPSGFCPALFQGDRLLAIGAFRPRH